MRMIGQEGPLLVPKEGFSQMTRRTIKVIKCTKILGETGKSIVFCLNEEVSWKCCMRETAYEKG